MPTYEYRCKDCTHEFDAVQSFTDDALTTCPECGGSLKKVFGSVGITFKGSGFYKTDSRTGSSGEKSSEKVGAAKDGSGGSGSSDSGSNGSSEKGGKDSAGSSSGESAKSTKSGAEKKPAAASSSASSSKSGSDS